MDPTLHKFSIFFPILLMAVIAIVLAGVLVAVSVLIGKRTKNAAKSSPYECGVDPVGDTRDPVPVKFFLVAISFVVFDIEIVFFYPWAIIQKDLGAFGFAAMSFFVVVLLVGYAFELGKGALKWE